MVGNRKHKLNKTWSCFCFHPDPDNEDEVNTAGYESDHEPKEEKQADNKKKQKGKVNKSQQKTVKGKGIARGKSGNNTKVNPPPKTVQKPIPERKATEPQPPQIGRASCRERVYVLV